MGEEQRYITPQKQQSTDYGRRKFIGNGLILLAGYAAGTTLLAGAGFAKRDSWPPRSDKELIIGSIDTAVMMAHLDYDAMVEKIKDEQVPVAVLKSFEDEFASVKTEIKSGAWYAHFEHTTATPGDQGKPGTSRAIPLHYSYKEKKTAKMWRLNSHLKVSGYHRKGYQKRL